MHAIVVILYLNLGYGLAGLRHSICHWMCCYPSIILIWIISSTSLILGMELIFLYFFFVGYGLVVSLN